MVPEMDEGFQRPVRGAETIRRRVSLIHNLELIMNCSIRGEAGTICTTGHDRPKLERGLPFELQFLGNHRKLLRVVMSLQTAITLHKV